MPAINDGPVSSLFAPVTLRGNVSLGRLGEAGVSDCMAERAEFAPAGRCAARGVPLKIGRVVVVGDRPVTVKVKASRAKWLVFAHTSDVRPLEWNADGFVPHSTGRAKLGEHAADYVIVYADGSEHRAAVRRGYEIGMIQRAWGEDPVAAVPDVKPATLRARGEDVNPLVEWGRLQTRVSSIDMRRWFNWLWAMPNPHPRKTIAAIRFEPVSGIVVVSAVTGGKTDSHPLRWETRRKAVLALPKGQAFDPAMDSMGRLKQIQLDLGQVISATPRALYPAAGWSRSYNNKLPEVSAREVIVEYTAHPEARLHLPGGRTVPVAKLKATAKAGRVRAIRPADQRVTLRVVDSATGRPVAVKLHVHGEAGEYLCPVDRHRAINSAWFQDYGVEFSHAGVHHCTYIPGETRIDLPLGRAYLEVSKGFEIRPVRKVLPITRRTKTVTVRLKKVLPWREKGWVSADTHVHFLSPPSALLEGAGEGVNVVNLLASQWGELMTNVGDFDGRTTHGSKAAGGDGEYLVRVGTENRQHILGHISLLGYEGEIIAPMTTGGPDESAIGDPVEVLLTEWAERCRRQKGVVVIPHMPNPRSENAAAIVSGGVDGVEQTSWGNLYAGISPYSLSDWYRYLNCGYMTAAVGGTDKMSARTAVGTVRTYARVNPNRPFTYETWKQAVRKAHTFVTYGPLMELAVEGRPPGSTVRMGRTGGTVDVEWRVASVTVPMTRVELIVNGEIRESRSVRPGEEAGHWSVRADRSCWMALLVRGRHRDKPEIIAAHSSPVTVAVKGTEVYAAADALTILEQIEGALAHLDTVGTRAETAAYKRMRLVLTGVHRKLHNRMHRQGRYHRHTPTEDHAEHH